MSTLAFIGLGSNLGDRKGHLDQAIEALGKTAGLAVRAVSAYHETAPVGGPPGQSPFLNAAASLETSLEPIALLRVLHDVEAQAARERGARWAPRTLDLDLLLYGDQKINENAGGASALRVPHPRMAVRRFVLEPLAEIAPDAVHPPTGRTITGLLANLDRRPSFVALLLDDEQEPVVPKLVNALHAQFVPMERPVDLALGRTELHLDHFIFSQELRLAMRTLSHTFDTNRWSAESLGDSWLVSETWFDTVARLAVGFVALEEWPRFQERFLEARSRIVQPTFLVVPEFLAASASHGRFPNAERWFPPLGETPVIGVESTTEDAILAEILAACAATRSG
jgi:2-amino-4-hydroxy-6-hydroxymethyldihydropteridine diphosphokinase